MWEGRRTGLLRMGNAVRCVVVRIQAVHHIWLRIGYVQVMNYLQSFLPLFTAIFNWVGDPVKYGPQLGPSLMWCIALIPRWPEWPDPESTHLSQPVWCLQNAVYCLVFGL